MTGLLLGAKWLHDAGSPKGGVNTYCPRPLSEGGACARGAGVVTQAVAAGQRDWPAGGRMPRFGQCRAPVPTADATHTMFCTRFVSVGLQACTAGYIRVICYATTSPYRLYCSKLYCQCVKTQTLFLKYICRSCFRYKLKHPVARVRPQKSVSGKETLVDRGITWGASGYIREWSTVCVR